MLVYMWYVHVHLVQDVYETFNLLMRRKPKENNFKVSQSVVHASVVCDDITLCTRLSWRPYGP